METTGSTLWVLALALVAAAAWSDWRSRRIPNWLTVPALFLGLGVNSLGSGWAGAKTALAGAGLALALLLPFVLLRGLGAGDWKLMGALGAFLGPIQILLVLFAAILVAGIMAAVQVSYRGSWKATLSNLGVLLRAFVTFRLRPHGEITLDNPKMLSLPFGVAVALATTVCYGAGLILRNL